MAEVATLLPGAELVEDISASNRAVAARVAADGTTYVAKRHHALDAFAKERSAYDLLPAAIRPALVAAGARVLIVEDIGRGPSLADLLLGDDAAKATAGLELWATTLAAALKPSLRDGRRDQPLDLAEHVGALRELGATLGVAAPAEFATDLDALCAPLNAASPWWAFGPSDACPDNNRVMADGTMKLFDFEGASWRHAASEAAYTIGPFCTCWCVARLPEEVMQATATAFLETLQPAQPEAFRYATEAAAVIYVLQSAGRFRYFVDKDIPIGPPGTAPSTGRQFVTFRLDSVARQAQRYPALADFAGRLAAAIRRRWPGTAPIPLYRAYRDR